MAVRKVYFLIIIILIIGCSRKIIIPANKDVYLSSQYPNLNFSGKNEPLSGKGFGNRRYTNNGYVSYPIMYLYSGDESSDSVKESFAVGGFDFSKIEGKVLDVKFKFFINYSSNKRKNVCINIRELTADWDDTSLTYLDVYKTSEIGAGFTNLVDSDIKKNKFALFNIKRQEIENLNIIPFLGSYKTVSIDVTSILMPYIKNKKPFYGFLIDPVWYNSRKYCTTNEYGELSDFGIVEIASSEWLSWNGEIPERFNKDNKTWIKIKNYAKGNVDYCPRLEIKVR